MAKDAKEELKKLPPEERLRKLKQLEEEKKKEIEEARKQLREVEEEITERKKFKDKIPIPEVALDDTSALSEAGKTFVKTHRGSSPRAKKKEEENQPEKKESLEETIEKTDASTQSVGVQYGDAAPKVEMGDLYARELGMRPMNQMYGEMKDINRLVAERGYMTSEENKKVEYIMQAVERKVDAAEAGAYTLTERLAQEVNVTHQLGETLREMYLSHREQLPKDRYRAGRG